MLFNDSVNTGNPISSKNAKDFNLTGVESSSVIISVTCGSQAYSFVATPFAGVVPIRIGEILRSLRPLAFGTIPTGDANAAVPAVTLTAEGEDDADPTPWSKNVFHGGYAEPAYPHLVDNTYWWTWRQQISRTYKHGKEYLAALFVAGSSAKAFSVTAKINYTDGTSQTKTIQSFTVPSGTQKFYIFDVSYSRVAALDTAVGKVIESYDIGGTSKITQRYVVRDADGNVRTFLFRNSLGLFDTIYSEGEFSEGIEYNTQTFVSGREESESVNDSRESISVKSGYLETIEEKNLWADFFLSDERYAWDGGTLRKIVIDEVQQENIFRKSSAASFSYHYAKEPAGRYMEKHAL